MHWETKKFTWLALLQWSGSELVVSLRYACTFAENLLKIIVTIRTYQCAKYIEKKSYGRRCCGSRTSQIQVHCRRSLTSAFGNGLVPFMESNYYKGWSEGAKGTLNLAVSIHCPVMVNLSRMFAIKKKESDVSLFNNRSVHVFKWTQSWCVLQLS